MAKKGTKKVTAAQAREIASASTDAAWTNLFHAVELLGAAGELQEVGSDERAAVLREVAEQKVSEALEAVYGVGTYFLSRKAA